MRKQGSWIWMGAFAALIGFSGEKAKAQTADSTNYVMADFESGSPLTTPLWGYWFFYNDQNSSTPVDSIKGNSVFTSFDPSGYPLYDTAGYYDTASFPKGRNGEDTSRAMRFAYKLGDRRLSCGDACTYAPYVGFGIGFSTKNGPAPNDTVDMTGAKAISFWAKADSDSVIVNVSVATRDTAYPTAADYGQRFKVTSEWKKYTITLAPSAQFAQPTWTQHKPFDLRHISGMGFGINSDENKQHLANAIRIDDLIIEGWTYVDPSTIEALHPWARSAGSRRGWRLQIQGSQIHIIRDGERIPLNLNGRAQLPR